MTHYDAKDSRADRPDIILLNPKRILRTGYDEFRKEFEEKYNVRDALLLQTDDPTAEWLAANGMTALSDEQRATFDSEGVVMLLQHQIVRGNRSIEYLAEEAVDFGYRQLAAEKRASIPAAELAEIDARHGSHHPGHAAWGPYVIERLDEMSDAERHAFFRQAYREMASPSGQRLIDLNEIGAMNEALSEAWSRRRDRIVNGRYVELRQAE